MITLNGEMTYDDFSKLKKNFEDKEKEFKHKFWIDEQISQLDDLMRLNYDKNIRDFSKIVLEFLTELTNAYSGVIYVLDAEMESLQAVSGFACTISKLPKQKYKLGEDTIGQVAKSKEWLLYENAQGENISTLNKKNIQSTTLLFLPLIFNEITYGVIELTYITDLSINHQEVLKKVSRNIAIMLESITKSDFTRTLLQASQEQTERLQSQEEELRQNLEELQATQEKMIQKQKEAEHLTKKLSANEVTLKKTLDRMKSNEAKTSNVLENCPFGIVIVDKSGKILITNKVMRLLLSFGEDALLPNYQEIFKLDKIDELKLGEKKITKLTTMKGTYLTVEIIATQSDENLLLYIRDLSDESAK